ncbi:MAG: protein kinase [Candidatus Eisenbacteria bacterium]
MLCPKCHHQNGPTASYCSGCGVALPSPRAPRPEGAGPGEAETVSAPFAGLTVGSIIAGRYRITQEVGKGGMGVVYKGEDIKLKRAVALKFLPWWLTRDDAAKERFIHEAQAASVLDHSNICTIYEIDETKDGQMFIAMAYCEGEVLKKTLERGPLNVGLALDIGIQVAAGLAEAHEAGMIHRDIKPANIMVNERGHVKIVDFGLAKLAGQTRLTVAGTVVGTVAYMSPEQARGEEVDLRTDIWSLGVVMYEMLAGGIPFRGENDQAIIHSILNDKPEHPTKISEGLPADLERVVLRCLNKDPRERYESAADLWADLNLIRGDSASHPSRVSAVVSGRANPPGSWLRRMRRRRMTTAIAGTGLAALVLLSILPPGDSVVTVRGIKRLMGISLVPRSRYVAVLPFEVGAVHGRELALCDGLTEVASRKFFRIAPLTDSLWIVPAYDVAQDKIATAGEARSQLGVNLVMAGRLKYSGDEVTLAMDLIDAKTQHLLKHTTIADPIANLSTWQDSLVVRMARMLNVKLPAAQYSFLKAGSTSVPNAYRAYLRGWGYLHPFGSAAQFDSATAAFGQAIAEDSSFAQAYVGMGETCLARYLAARDKDKDSRLLEDAIRWGERATGVQDQSPAAFTLQGVARTHLGRYDDAIIAFRKAIDADSSYAEAYDGEMRAYYDLGKYDLAADACHKEIKLRPRSCSVYRWLAYIYYTQLDYPNAIKQYEMMIKLCPNDTRGYEGLGVAYFDMRKWPEASRAFQQAVAIKPDDNTYSNLGTIYFYDARYADAAKMYKAALDLSDDDYLVWAHYAACLALIPGEEYKAGAIYGTAIAMAEEKLKATPGSVSTMADLASYYATVADSARALAYLGEVLSGNPTDQPVLFRVVETYELLGQRENSLKWVEKAMAQGYPLTMFDLYPATLGLRNDQRFKQLKQQTQD